MGREYRADGGDERRPRANPGSLAAYAITWTVMMIAMMLPSPMRPVLEQSGADRRTAFAAGYLAMWVLAGLLGYAALRLGRLQSGSSDGTGPGVRPPPRCWRRLPRSS
jgi:predicted metal-binding membrane protein